MLSFDPVCGVWERVVVVYFKQFFKRLKCYEKPVLGDTPKFTQTSIDVMPGLNQIDTTIFIAAAKLAISDNERLLHSAKVFDMVKDLDISEADFFESLEILDKKYFIKAERVLGGNVPCFQITTHGFDLFCRAEFQDYDLMIKTVGLAILNNNLNTNLQIEAETKLPIYFIDHVLELLDKKSLLKITRTLGGVIYIFVTSPEMKRIFDKQTG